VTNNLEIQRKLVSEQGDQQNRLAAIRVSYLATKEMTWLFWKFKRLADLLIVGISLILLSPLLAGIALLIKLSSRGPVFFVQDRIGQGYQLFKIYKFRTMYHVLDEDNHLYQELQETSKKRISIEDDVRITRMGRFLRNWSLDELPQLVNILKGEMSIVGPRPLMVTETAKIPETYHQRFSVPSGLTGLAQITNRMSFTTDRFALDLIYVEKMSLWQDLKITLKTFKVIKQVDYDETKKVLKEHHIADVNETDSVA